MRRPLPALNLKTTRVRLLAWSYSDAFQPDASGAPGEHGHRMNLHGNLWTKGSYRELANAMTPFFGTFYCDRKLQDHPVETRELKQVTDLMPADVFVPAEIAEAAGYLPSEAKVYAMPKRMERLRWARVG